MNTLLVSYDLNKPKQDYETLLKHLRSYGTYWHHLDSFWLVKSTETATQLRDTLKALIDTNDELLVMNVTGDGWASTGFTEKGTKWLKDHV